MTGPPRCVEPCRADPDHRRRESLAAAVKVALRRKASRSMSPTTGWTASDGAEDLYDLVVLDILLRA